MTKAQIARKARMAALKATVAKFLMDGLDATTTYSEPVTPRSDHSALKWRPLYGGKISLVPDARLVDADGQPTGFRLKREWSHQPGDIFDSNSKPNTHGKLVKYIVQENHSLRKAA